LTHLCLRFPYFSHDSSIFLWISYFPHEAAFYLWIPLFVVWCRQTCAWIKITWKQRTTSTREENFLSLVSLSLTPDPFLFAWPTDQGIHVWLIPALEHKLVACDVTGNTNKVIQQRITRKKRDMLHRECTWKHREDWW
jgi:hypothetical protein